MGLSPFKSGRDKRSVGERNQNEGNIEDGPYARSQPGYAGSDGRFAKFDSPEAGANAQIRLLQGKGYAGLPISGIIQRYAPLKSRGGDNTEAQVRNYIGYVAARAGIDPDGQIDPSKLGAVASAMREFETGKRPKIQFAAYGGQLRGGTGVSGGQDVPGGTLPPQVDVTTIQPSEGEKARMATDPYTITNPFDPNFSNTIKDQTGTVASRGANADTVLTDVISGLQAIQPQREENLRNAVDAKKAITAEVRTETQGLIARMRPLFAKREAIARRQSEMGDMNPLERFVRGITDPNYNEVDLRGRDYAAANELGVLGDNYKTLTGLQDNLLKLIDTDYQGNESLFNLQRENLSEDFTLASQSFGLSQQILGASMQGLDNQMAIIRSRNLAITDTLGKMSIGEVNAAYEDATKNGTGYAVVNGVPISLGQLKQQQDSFRDAQMAFESRQLALESGRIGLANQYEDQLIGKMSDADIDSAVKNGGMYNGQQLDMTKLGTEYARRGQIREQRAQGLAMESAPGTMKTMIGSIQSITTGSTARMTSLFGKVPEDQKQLMVGVNAEVQALMAEWQKADAQGIGKEWAAQNMARIQGLYKQQQTVISNLATRWAGGNKDLLPLAQGWLTGSPINAETAAKGFIAMARNGIPAGTNLTGPALKAFQTAQRLVAENDKPQSGQSVDAMLRGNDKDRDRALIQRVQTEIGKVYTSNLSSVILRATPDLAKGININGQPSAFAMVPRETFLQALSYAEQRTQEAGLKTPKERNAFKMRTLLDALDASIDLSARGIKASDAYIQLINDPNYQDAARRVADKYQSSNGFGDYLAGSIGGTSVSNDMQDYGQALVATQAVRKRDILSSRIEKANSIAGDPYQRARMVLAVIDGVTPKDSDALLGYYKPLVESQFSDPTKQVMMGFGSNSAAEYKSSLDNLRLDALEDLIQNNRIQDPRLEAIRKRVAAAWPKQKTIIDRVVDIFK